MLKGQIQQQICQGAGDIVSVQCQQILNVKNIHTTTVKGSNIRIGAPGLTSSGASPVVLYIPDTGYVELTGVHNIGSGEATISYIVLVPAK